LADGQAATVSQTVSGTTAKNVITIHLTHQINHTTTTTTQTVNYVQQGKSTPLIPATTQTITWNVSTDAVTKNSVYTPQGGYAATTPATIAGYTPVGTGIAQNMPAPTTTAPQADNET
ncbi:hypothetical protein, partial [Secundilactobacillus odoratitofui]|uniref:hypothetical protein n=1 Tax=Secundilactobacillus odoratitofui TaxID=480930 RepID=UPI003B838CF8